MKEISRGTLFIVPTPIGNLRDITLRALEILGSVDLIACEDTRHTIKLLNHYGIKKPLMSYERFSESRKLNHLLDRLENGESIALVSDGGTPLISDPGARLVAEARTHGISVTALPGACAFVTALSASGLDGAFRFIGFFPRKESEAVSEILRIKNSGEAAVFYESPRRLVSTLRRLSEHMGDTQVFIARELTKLHEECFSGCINDAIARFCNIEPKGEITVIITGCKDGPEDLPDINVKLEELLDQGYSKRDIAKTLHDLYMIPRNDIYAMLIKRGRS